MFDDKKHYEIINPQTGNKEVWTGERINAYKISYRAEIKIAPPPPKRTTKKKKDE